MNKDQLMPLPVDKIPAELRPYYDHLLKTFMQRVKNGDQISSNRPISERIYYKWAGTWQIRRDMNVTADIARKNLNKLEQLGLLKSKRRINYILWCIIDIEGFEQSKQYEDYYIRS